MIKLYIDNKPADIDASTSVSISLSIASVTSIEHGKAGYSKSITIPATPLNRLLLGDCEQINNRDMFNSDTHTARIEYDGFTVIDGEMLMTECNLNGAGSYKFNIIGGSKNWANHAAKYSISTLKINYSEILSGNLILNSWTDKNSCVCFLPVEREIYQLTNSSVSLMPAARILSSRDYHPFIHIRTLLETIFKEASYDIVSEFFNTDFFNSLYMSGRYPFRDAESLKDSMDFKAGRFADVSATADEFGRVFADPYSNYNSIGNIVDTANPDEKQNGVSAEGVFNNGGCFKNENRGICFIPTSEVSVSFDYHFKYITQYTIMSREELSGFNTITLPGNDTRSFKITNSFTPRRNNFQAGKNHRIVVFNHVYGTQYRLIADQITNEDADPDNLQETDTQELIISTFGARSILVSHNSEYTLTNLRLLVYSGSAYIPYDGDWELYDGYIGEYGEKEVDVKLRGKCERISPSKPKYFDTLYFSGAEPGTRITIECGTEITPVFNPHPTEGSKLDFGQVACYTENRASLINAIKNMFNLCFYTDNLTKKVYIEPRKNFFSDDVIIDMSDRIDFSMPIKTQELGDDMSRIQIFKYRSGDKTVAKWNLNNDDEFGTWKAEINNHFASENDTIYENTLFAPSINTDNCMPNALSALLIQTSDSGSSNDYEDFNFTPKIVCYKGLVPLNNNEQWNYPSYGTEYPFAGFHYPDGNLCEPFTLCFEDRDGVNGLHEYWDENIKYYNFSKKVTLYLHLYPEEVEALLIPNSLKHDFRAKFAMTIDGEKSFYRLEEICDYNPKATSTKCIFIKIV